MENSLGCGSALCTCYPSVWCTGQLSPACHSSCYKLQEDRRGSLQNSCADGTGQIRGYCCCLVFGMVVSRKHRWWCCCVEVLKGAGDDICSPASILPGLAILTTTKNDHTPDNCGATERHSISGCLGEPFHATIT